jgi:phosphate starvation-inducible PhoH-like protein
VVTGDISQTDLPATEVSGMIEAMNLLRGIHGIGFAALTQRDIIRHRLVQDIVDAYESRSPTPPSSERKAEQAS